MATVRERTVGHQKYYYLVQTVRVGHSVRTLERYLGKSVPPDLTTARAELERRADSTKWYPILDKIRGEYRSELRNTPRTVREKALEQFIVKFTYDTNRLEGSALTFHETALLLREGVTPRNRPISDVIETRAHAALARQVFVVSGDPSLTLKRVMRWHTELFKETKKDIAGRIRTYAVGISNGRFSPPPAGEVPHLLRDLFSYYSREKRATHPVELAAVVHYRFESIHPFGDGNGRTGRMILNFVLHRAGYPMIDLRAERKRRYSRAIERAQVQRDERAFVTWFLREYCLECKHYLTVV
ncbi:MAG: Fic family protein [Euryarchaeota archaeon]|nr:Fic family protein [Euryarchaeota archaeon]MDE1836010.1 Fic family protein [Euryarchaeota archaeon]MDE1881605.1 Fic family protein [Euryarchaeota archaeon]MDE2045998.1 Fic family protein [Thermoplasmata archaeon]